MKSTGSLCCIFILFLCVASASADDHQPSSEMRVEFIRVITPQENDGVVGKKPEIQVEFAGAVRPDSLLVMLDGTDITQLLDLAENGFRYKPFLVLPAGMHSLSISVSDSEGRQFQKNISFTTQHSKTFDEVYTSNDASLIYETILSNPDAFPQIPDSKVEGNLRSDTKIRKGQLESTFTTNLRYFDQNLPSPYIQKGITVANWLFTGAYTKDFMKFKADIGDVMVNETMYTVSNLARRGGVFGFHYDNVQLSAFSVKSEQVFGMRGGVGIEGTSDDHILGASGLVHFYDRKLVFKGVYATGGEPSGSFGISTTSGKKKGDVIGFLITSDFFQNKLRTEIEAGFSKYDPDTSDEFGSRNDNAYKLKAGGSLGSYNYEAAYEYIGRDYAVAGNQMIQKDKEGVTFVNGLNLFPHTINLNLSRYNDNVKSDDLFPRIVNYQAMLDYSFNGIPNLPFGFSYQKSIQDSTREPDKYYELNMHTDMIAGRVNYMKDRLNVGFQTSYSQQDDRTKGNNDTKTLTFSLIPSYNITNVSFSPAFSYNRTEFPQRDMHTDTYTINADLRTRFFREKGSFDIGSSYNIMKSSDGSMNNRTLNSNFRLAYAFRNFLKGYVNPTIALRGTHLKVTDKVYSQSDKDEFLLMFVLTAAMPYSF